MGYPLNLFRSPATYIHSEMLKQLGNIIFFTTIKVNTVFSKLNAIKLKSNRSEFVIIKIVWFNILNLYEYGE